MNSIKPVKALIILSASENDKRSQDTEWLKV